MLIRYLDPTNDLAFRKIFGARDRTAALVSLLNAMLGLSGDRAVASVAIGNPYEFPRIAELKETIVDVKATDKAGRDFVVEMQCEGGAAWFKRALLATCKAYANQLGPAEGYSSLNAVHFIGILRFTMPWDAVLAPGAGRARRRRPAPAPDAPARPWLTQVMLHDVATLRPVTTDFSLHFMELPAFDKPLEECGTAAEKWAWFFRHCAEQTKVPDGLDDPGIAEAFDTAEKFGWSAAELDIYEGHAQKLWLNHYNIEEAAEAGEARGIEIGEARGIEIGEARGIEIGKQEGIEIGARKTRDDAARRMRALGMDSATIAASLQIPPEEMDAILLFP